MDLWDLRYLIKQFMGVFGLVEKIGTIADDGGRGENKNAMSDVAWACVEKCC